MKTVSSEINLPETEKSILTKWEKTNAFAKQNERRKGAKEFAFYDGPPFANGLPHYGHLLTNTIKDVVPRYWIMKGYKVERRFGWDCHGLPVEFEIEKTHNLKGREDILSLGVEKFNELCKTSVSHFTKEWQRTITRLGRWVDWNNQYRTMDLHFMESVWWVFAELFRKDLIYQGFKVVPYSPRTGSVVSNFEANQNYKVVQDPAITVKFREKGTKNSYFLSWTTTPWTLPSNLALAMGPKVSYSKIYIKSKDEYWTLATERIEALCQKVFAGQKDFSTEYEIIATYFGEELVGQEYECLFPFFSTTKNAFRVVNADFVQLSEGTGIVHLAPAFGEDDFFACKKEGIELVDPIDDSAIFTASCPDYAGLYIKDADKKIIKDLKTKEALLLHETINHSYPFDERTDTPLIYKAVPSWYVAVEKILPRLCANNQKINWVPAHVKNGRMGSWLENARDWAISRNRFWGTPLPVWICKEDKEHLEVFASIKELAERSGQKIHDLHKDKMQKIAFACHKCSGEMACVDFVFDCWFESGSMPYAQLHYPFENKERFEQIFPADFIGEGLDQTRGWFYTLSVLSTALFDKPAFQNVIVNGVILDESGKKMSKRKKNYTPPEALLEQNGADSIRLYMLNSQLLKAENLIFMDKGVKDITRLILIPLWNAYSFLSTYAKAEGYTLKSNLLAEDYVPASVHVLDKWIITRLHSMMFDVQKHMESYQLYLVVPKVLSFVEDLTNWYIRLSRRRFWASGEQKRESIGAFDTLSYVLERFLRVFAPFAPFITEELYSYLCQDLIKEPCVHLTDLPKPSEDLLLRELESQMEIIRQVVNLARSLRQAHKLKTRQVLPRLLVITANEQDQEAINLGQSIIATELNVKSIDFTTDEAKHVRLTLKPNLANLGKKLGKDLAALRQLLAEINTSQESVKAFLDSLTQKDGYNFLSHQILRDDVLLERSPLDDRLIATEGTLTVVLDTKLTKELELEGLAREIVNRIQNLRKDSKLEVADRITVELEGDPLLLEAALAHQSYIQGETLTEQLAFLAKDAIPSLAYTQAFDIDDLRLKVSLSPR